MRYTIAQPEVTDMKAFGEFYPPFLQEAVEHAERLVQLLRGLDPRSARPRASTWLVGRAEEVECLVGELMFEWRCGVMTAPEAAQAVNAYLQALHRGLAMNFSELAPSCCMNALVVTATPASFVDTTAPFPPMLDPAWNDADSTWGEVDEAELFDASSMPSSR